MTRTLFDDIQALREALDEYDAALDEFMLTDPGRPASEVDAWCDRTFEALYAAVEALVR